MGIEDKDGGWACEIIYAKLDDFGNLNFFLKSKKFNK